MTDQTADLREQFRALAEHWKAHEAIRDALALIEPLLDAKDVEGCMQELSYQTEAEENYRRALRAEAALADRDRVIERVRGLIETYRSIHNDHPGAPGSRERIYYGVTIELSAIVNDDRALAGDSQDRP